MFKKIIVFILILLLAVCALSACSKSANTGGNIASDSSAESPSAPPQADKDSSFYSSNAAPDATLERKIVYYADLMLESLDIGATEARIAAAMNDDEWFDSQSRSNGRISLTARIKSNRLYEFLDAVKAGNDTLVNSNVRGDDISRYYQSIEDSIDALNEEKQILIDYANKYSDGALQTAKRIAEINTEIKRLNGQLKNYDSLVDYSTVTISIYEVNAEGKRTYSETAASTFEKAWKALGSMFKFLGLAVIAVFPFALVFIPVGILILICVKFVKKKKIEKQKADEGFDEGESRIENGENGEDK